MANGPKLMRSAGLVGRAVIPANEALHSLATESYLSSGMSTYSPSNCETSCLFSTGSGAAMAQAAKATIATFGCMTRLMHESFPRPRNERKGTEDVLRCRQ